jgi:hypothetical protein
MPFTCSICGEESTRICARCTKDACNNHLCDKCLRCSDCCECEVVLSEASRPMVRPVVHRPLIVEDDEEEQAEMEMDPEPQAEPETLPTPQETPSSQPPEGEA